MECVGKGCGVYLATHIISDLRRIQTVTMIGHTSLPVTIMVGAPQGCVLGPFIFTDFVNKTEYFCAPASPIQDADDGSFLIFKICHYQPVSNSERCLSTLGLKN